MIYSISIIFTLERWLKIKLAELQLNKTNASDTEVASHDVNLSIISDTVSRYIYI